MQSNNIKQQKPLQFSISKIFQPESQRLTFILLNLNNLFLALHILEVSKRNKNTSTSQILIYSLHIEELMPPIGLVPKNRIITYLDNLI